MTAAEAMAAKTRPAANRLRMVTARMAHVYRLAANLRDEDLAMAAKLGRDARLALRLSYKSSTFYRCAITDGDDVLVMWGLSGDALSDHGYPWMITSKDAARLRLRLLKFGRRELRRMMRLRRVLVDYVAPDDARAARFLVFLGFVRTDDGPRPMIGDVAWHRY
ncbi:MAG TPA: hypothetical protein VHY10_16410, partial [Xanthobacteraceae bacterium]|nr:hypothetical protein [Xanthobacteraceae bacterium]